MLKYTEKTIIQVNDDDLDRYVNEVFPNSGYNFVADVESQNDTSHEFSVDGDYNIDEIESVRAGRWNYSISDILNFLAGIGLIPKGEYIISVSW